MRSLLLFTRKKWVPLGDGGEIHLEFLYKNRYFANMVSQVSLPKPFAHRKSKIIQDKDDKNPFIEVDKKEANPAPLSGTPYTEMSTPYSNDGRSSFDTNFDNVYSNVKQEPMIPKSSAPHPNNWAKASLPPGWEIKLDHNGKPFYYDKYAKVTTYFDPRENKPYASPFRILVSKI
jgi:hypothetical protein